MPKLKPSEPVRGVYAALATPRRSNSTEIDSAAFFDYQDEILRAGVDGLVLFGSTGEFVHFDVSDRMHAVGLLCKRSRVPVLVNVSHSSLDGAVALAESALSAGAVGLLLMAPYFYNYTDEQLLAFFEQFSAILETGRPLFLYNLPFFTNPLRYPLIESLLASGRYAGIKDSSGDHELFQSLAALHKERPFIWLAGNESLYLQSRVAGAEGTISGVAAAVPELMVAMDRAISTGGLELGERLNRPLQEFLQWLNRFPATIAIKQAAVVRGWKLDQPTFRFDQATQNELRNFRRWFEDWLPRTLAECAEPATVKA
jgi:dihydrodipicolinate synthase/N-acetylneuraminate lyase